MSIEHNIMQVSQAQLLYSHVLGMSNVTVYRRRLDKLWGAVSKSECAGACRLGQSSGRTCSAEDLACEQKDLFSPSHL